MTTTTYLLTTSSAIAFFLFSLLLSLLSCPTGLEPTDDYSLSHGWTGLNWTGPVPHAAPPIDTTAVLHHFNFPAILAPGVHHQLMSVHVPYCTVLSVQVVVVGQVQVCNNVRLYLFIDLSDLSLSLSLSLSVYLIYLIKASLYTPRKLRWPPMTRADQSPHSSTIPLHFLPPCCCSREVTRLRFVLAGLDCTCVEASSSAGRVYKPLSFSPGPLPLRSPSFILLNFQQLPPHHITSPHISPSFHLPTTHHPIQSNPIQSIHPSNLSLPSDLKSPTLSISHSLTHTRTYTNPSIHRQ